MGGSINYNQIAERYVASWNEKDPDVRRKLIDELWAEDGRYFNRLFVMRGRDMIDSVISTAHEEYFSKGFSFKSQNDAYGHHGGMKFGWVMVTSVTGEVDTYGQEFVVLDHNGKIAMDFMFGMKPPSF